MPQENPLDDDHALLILRIDNEQELTTLDPELRSAYKQSSPVYQNTVNPQEVDLTPLIDLKTLCEAVPNIRLNNDVTPIEKTDTPPITQPYLTRYNPKESKDILRASPSPMKHRAPMKRANKPPKMRKDNLRNQPKGENFKWTFGEENTEVVFFILGPQELRKAIVHPGMPNVHYYQARIRNQYPQKHLWSGWATREEAIARTELHFQKEKLENDEPLPNSSQPRGRNKRSR